MGTTTTIQYNTTMKTILLICAFAAFVSALPSDDVETDLLTPTTDDIVPEDTLVQETATAGKTVACSSLFNDATEDAVYKGKKYKASPRCYCKPLEARNWNIGKTNDHYKAKENLNNMKIYPSERKDPCDGLGLSYANECSPPKPKKVPPKKCTCMVDVGKVRKEIISSTGKGVYFNWAKIHDKRFREITCQGCSMVTAYDDDVHGKDHKTMHCPGKKTCHTEARGFFCSHDLCDDVNWIYLGPAA